MYDLIDLLGSSICLYVMKGRLLVLLVVMLINMDSSSIIHDI